MKIETNKRDLEAVLDLVGVAKGSGKADNVATHACFQARGGQVEILASNTRLGARGVLTANVQGDGAFTVEFWRLTKWLDAVGDAPVTLRLDGTRVVISSASSRIVLQSLNPAEFPMVPETPEGKGSEIDAKRLHGMLSYLRAFVLEQETIQPQYNVAQVKRGSFWACNQKSLVIMTIPELEQTKLHLHKLEFPGVLAYLAACGGRPAKIVERPSGGVEGFHLVHPGGSALYVPKPRKDFPDLSGELHALEGEAACVWEISPEQLLTSIEGLTASADNENYYVRMSTAGADMLEVSIKAAFSSEDSTAQVPAKIRATKRFSGMADAKLEFHHPSLLAALGKQKEAIVALQIYAPSDGKKGRQEGLSRLVSKSKDGDEVHTILHWKAQ